MKNWRKKDSLWLPKLGNEKGFITILTGGVPSAAYYPVDDTCVLYHDYALDPTGTDHSIYGNNGAVDGATSGPLGLTFDGIDDVCITPHAASLVFTTFTIEMWWYPIALPLTFGRMSGKATLWSSGFSFCDLYETGTGRHFHCFTGSNWQNIPYTYSVSNWYHSVWIWDGTYQRLYINNNQETPVDRTGLVFASSTANLKLGELLGPGSYPTGDSVNMICGEYRLWNVPLSTAQVGVLYNATKARYGY